MERSPVGAAHSDVLASLLVAITEACELEEVGSPYMTLRAAGSSSRLGVVRVWQQPLRRPGTTIMVEKLVYLQLQTSKFFVQWIFLFSGQDSLVPHYSNATKLLPAALLSPLLSAGTHTRTQREAISARGMAVPCSLPPSFTADLRSPRCS